MNSGAMSEALQFTFGLINNHNKYLTAETFGFKIAASASSLKKKQIWRLEQRDDGANVYFKSHLERYLGADKNGKVSCDTENPGPENAFQVEATFDGKWAIKSSKYGRYFGGNGDNLSCFEQTICKSYLWNVHLAMHPQINIFNDRRKAYAHNTDKEVHMKKTIPWGIETLITLMFSNNGYALVTSNNQYLSSEGELVDACSASTLYHIEFYSGNIAFKSVSSGKYLAPVGPTGNLKGRKVKAGKDEFFTIIDSHPQVTLFSKTKQKFVSGKQGLQLSANQYEAEERENFQMEIDSDTSKVYFRNSDVKYWNMDTNSVKADADKKTSADTAFTIEWHGRYITLKGNSGRYIKILPSGHLSCGDTPEEFIFRLTNRPLIVFRGENGFIASKGEKLEGNRSSYDIFQMEDMDGAYAIKAPNGKYWCVDCDKKVAANSEVQVPFLIELTKKSRLAIRPEGGDYITSDHVGIMTATGSEITKKTLWEY